MEYSPRVRLIVMLLVTAGAVVYWYIRSRRRESVLRLEQDATRAARRKTLEDAACAVEHQAELSRSVALRIENAPVEVPFSLRAALGAVVEELDGVASDLRSCQVPVVERRTLIHR